MKTIILLCMSCLFGNYMGDRQIIRDCAMNGRAVMYGGGAVECKVELL